MTDQTTDAAVERFPKHDESELGWNIVSNLRWLAEQDHRPGRVPEGSLTGVFLNLCADRLAEFAAERQRAERAEQEKAALAVSLRATAEAAASSAKRAERAEKLLAQDLTDVEVEAALTSEGILTWGPDGEIFERMFGIVMALRTAQTDQTLAVEQTIKPAGELGARTPPHDGGEIE